MSSNPPSPADLHAAAEELLYASIEALDTVPVFDPTLLGAPDRVLVSFGSPVQDCCDQLAVNVYQVLDMPTQGGLAAGRKIAAKLTHVYLAVTISRCFPMPDDKGNPPSVVEQEAAAVQLDADGWALWNHLYNLWIADQLFTFCDEVVWDGMRPVGPSGGCAGWLLAIHISLDGYQEVISS